ncbi:type 2 lanthipeptide synthetase LanM family protein [Flavobacterium sp.]|uniref:type 2 lanthipeptide synthetase LanM family protein n=1 Tax=Flavobacterium sp. TaxID=239 RepID=UPI0026187E5F|nr:type 2 lanthipeptide synthetase LanM family protein [Flavobacterium sp.]
MNQIIFQEQIEKISNFIESKDNLLHLNQSNRNQILKNVAYICKFAFDKDYNNFKGLNASFQFLFQNFNSEDSESVFANYTRDFDSHQFKNKFPLLPKLINKKAKLSSKYIKNILQHFSNDSAEISELFHNKKEIGDIIEIELDNGDVHQGGKTTAIIHFENNVKLVYKARSSAIDLAFNSLINQMNRNADCMDLKAIKTLDKTEYCWMEFIENKPCETLKDLQDYYKRCGVLTALIYFLRGTDMHFENLIANGSYPMLIDLECLFNTNLTEFNVLHTGLIPNLVYSDDTSEAIDLSAFGASGTQESSNKIWNWNAIGSDDLNLVREKGKFKATTNQPKFNGESVSPKDYIDDFISEFENTGQYILNNKSSFKQEFHLLSEFKNKVVRVIPRPTQDYKTILENSYIPNALVSKENRKSLIEKYLNDFFLIINFDEKEKEIVMLSELKAIEKMDIPYFTTNTTEKILCESNKCILPDYFLKTSYDFVMDELDKFDQSQLDHQVKIIKSAFSARYDVQKKSDLSLDLNSKTTTIVEEISKIAAQLKKQSELNHNQYNWYSFESIDGKNLSYSTLENSLYSGSLGIVLYLSAVSKFANTSEYDEIINSVLNYQVNAALESFENKAVQKANISFSTGISGLIYTLLSVDSDKYKNQALELSAFLTLDNIHENGKLDIMAGASGILVVLTKLYVMTKQKTILDQCISVGNHINSLKYIDEETNLMVWDSDTTKKPLTGFSHGVSGIGYALLKLFEITGNEDYKDAFYEALHYENCFYNGEEQNWADLRKKQNNFLNSWCYGASGIGLNRLYAYQILKDEKLLSDIENAVEVTKNSPLLDSEFYCCGNVGRIDFLIQAAKVLNDEPLKGFIRNKINEILKKKTDLDYFQTFTNKNISIENPSLFRGTSGIGYTLLRALDSDQFLCFGLLE